MWFPQESRKDSVTDVLLVKKIHPLHYPAFVFEKHGWSSTGASIPSSDY